MACRSRITAALRRARVPMPTPSRYAVPARQALASLPRAQSRLQSTTSATSSEKTTATDKGIAFTSESYPQLKRDSRFAQLTPAHVAHFRQLLGADSALIDGVERDAADDIEPFNSDWMRKYRGHAQLVLKPATTEQVSAVLRYCNEQMLAVVPQGGNSGLVGGSVPVFDEIVLHMGRLNRVRSFDDVSGILVADAGCILEPTDAFLAERGHVFPLDLGAKGSCHIGANVATNAGGLRLLRYGSLHGSVLGIEAVLPDGTVVDDLSTLRKDNTGYDVKQLFIGAEGTLGIITAISIQCPQRSPSTNVAFFGLDSYAAAQRAFIEAKTHLGEILSAFELMDRNSQRLVRTATANTPPLEAEYPFYCLVETSGSNADHDSDKLERFLELVMERGVVADGVLAQDESQARALWGWREGVSEASAHFGGVYKYDVSLPLDAMYGLVDATRAHLQAAGLVGDEDAAPVVDVVGYGHMGDANLHLNVAVRRYDKAVERALEPFVFEWIRERRGSISAEHGLGLAKKQYIGYSRSETMVRLMKQIKNLYDPVSFSFFLTCALLTV